MKYKPCEECNDAMHVNHQSVFFDKKYFCSFVCLSDWAYDNATHYVLQEADCDYFYEDDAE